MPLKTGVMEQKKMIVAGKWVERDKTIGVYDPQDDSLISTVPAASSEDVHKAIAGGTEGVRIAAQMPTHERMAVLNRAADLIAEREDVFATTIAREGSKTIREALKEVRRSMDTLRISAEEARRLHGETIPFDQKSGSENRLGYYYRFPVGLIAAITPFNDPLNLVAHKVGPAIAAGNAVIVKPSTVTPLSALQLAEVLFEAGLPPKVLSVVTGYGREIGDPLVMHPEVRMISFTEPALIKRRIFSRAPS